MLLEIVQDPEHLSFSDLRYYCVVLQSARMRAAGVGKDFKENPNLRDNWTDAEGYYRKCCPIISYLFPDVVWKHACNF